MKDHKTNKIIFTLTRFKWLIAFFTVFIAMQILQIGWSWDEIVYSYQGKWFCAEQVYFEWLRPPLPGIVNCLSGAGQYSNLISTAAASIAYFAATLLVYKNEKNADQFTFAAFAFLFPTILIHSNAGSDLFAISFLLISFALENPLHKGIAFGLATLSRYNFLLYIILLPMQMKGKKWHLFLLPFIILWLPWIAFNYLATGNPFFSIEESFVLNIAQKGIISQITTEFLIPIIFFIAAFAISPKFSKYNLAGIISLIQFVFSGIKESRFLAQLAIPQAINISSKSTGDKKAKFAFSFVLLILFTWIFFTGFKFEAPELSVPGKADLGECRVLTDKWVFFYDKNIIAEPLPRSDSFEYNLRSGNTLVIYDKALWNAIPQGFEVEKTQEYLLAKPIGCQPRPAYYISKVWRGN